VSTDKPRAKLRKAKFATDYEKEGRKASWDVALPFLTKALTEANHARFRITSQVDTGTLVEVAFPATRVLAQ